MYIVACNSLGVLLGSEAEFERVFIVFVCCLLAFLEENIIYMIMLAMRSYDMRIAWLLFRTKCGLNNGIQNLDFYSMSLLISGKV